MNSQEKKAGLSWKIKDWIAGYIFIAPVTIGLTVFYIWPFLQNFWFSFNDVNKFNVTHFIGLENYKQLLSDPEVFQTFGNTLKYVVVTVPVGLFLSLVTAALLNSNIKGKSLYRTLYFLPSVTMAAAVAMVWKWVFNGQMGILNSIITSLGGPRIGWLIDPKLALYVIMLVGLWMSVGYNMIILLAGMQGISKTYYEAAAIDGAGPIRRFLTVTVPGVKVMMFLVATLTTIGCLKIFTEVYLLGGSASPTKTLTMYIRDRIVDPTFGSLGQGDAASVCLFLITFGFIIASQSLQRKAEDS